MDMSAAPADDQNEVKRKKQFTGTVTKITLAGAIVDLGTGVPGMLHISQIKSADDQPVKRVEDVIQIGQQVETWVRKVREDHVELTMFKPLDLEWRDLKKGMTVQGKVVRLEKFGAFVEIGAERPGLIHISEMAHGYVRIPSDVVKEGDDVEAQVLDINRRKKQIKLSLKALQPEPEKEEPAKLIENAQREKPARRRRKKGEEGSPRSEEQTHIESSEASEPDPTAMEIALREAMEKAKARKKDTGKKKTRGLSNEQDDILSRTLEHKIKTS
jgi:predicted RNA-binding protein with RPS1 domain